MRPLQIPGYFRAHNGISSNGRFRRHAKLHILSTQLAEPPTDEPRPIFATGRYLGEGFDDARLDTLFLAMPISWRGTLSQYAGRLHRLSDAKHEVVIQDYADLGVPVLAPMHTKRRAGYKALGYVFGDARKTHNPSQLTLTGDTT